MYSGIAFSPTAPQYVCAAYSPLLTPRPSITNNNNSESLPFPLTEAQISNGFVLVWSLAHLSAYNTPYSEHTKNSIMDRPPYRFVLFVIYIVFFF